MGFVPDFRIVHLGVNCADEAEAGACADTFERLFGLPAEKSGTSSAFTGTQIEWMKGGGRGTNGHIAIETKDLPGARAYLEEKGFLFDDASAKFGKDGRMAVLYARKEIGGFAIHLLQA